MKCSRSACPPGSFNNRGIWVWGWGKSRPNRGLCLHIPSPPTRCGSRSVLHPEPGRPTPRTLRFLKHSSPEPVSATVGKAQHRLEQGEPGCLRSRPQKAPGAGSSRRQCPDCLFGQLAGGGKGRDKTHLVVSKALDRASHQNVLSRLTQRQQRPSRGLNAGCRRVSQEL